MNLPLFLLQMALSYAGFTALCLSMEKHVMELKPAARADATGRRRWRWLGGSFIVLALLIATHAQGWAHGPMFWLGALTCAGLLLSLGVLPYRPAWLAALGWGLAALAASAWMYATLA